MLTPIANSESLFSNVTVGAASGAGEQALWKYTTYVLAAGWDMMWNSI